MCNQRLVLQALQDGGWVGGGLQRRDAVRSGCFSWGTTQKRTGQKETHCFVACRAAFWKDREPRQNSSISLLFLHKAGVGTFGQTHPRSRARAFHTHMKELARNATAPTNPRLWRQKYATTRSVSPPQQSMRYRYINCWQNTTKKRDYIFNGFVTKQHLQLRSIVEGWINITK